ncbi:MAG: IS110 family transposase [Phormidium tanganyikae FI6-MK23]|jgi:transposase|nr:IS110 family transposase [Phormidium tanganyikae FI6-MK23]
METQQQWIGIDISQTRLDVALYPLGVSFSVNQTEGGRAELVSKLTGYAIAGIVLESTGGLERCVMAELEAHGYETRRVNPAQVQHFAKAMGRLAKTDRIDAEMIARFGESRNPEVTRLPEATIRELQALVARRQQVVELITMEKKRLHSCESWVRESVNSVLSALETELKTLEARLAELSAKRPEWQEHLAILTSVKGIGTVISQALLVSLPELGARSGRTIAALVGVAPFNRDSGKLKGQRRIQGGRKELRSLLYMAALCAVQHNPVIRDHYQQLTKRGKAKKVALVACLRKLLVILNAMLRDRQPWRHPAPSAV